MVDLTDDERDLLNQALAKSQKLVDELRRQQADLEMHPPKLEAAKMAAGRDAVAKAIASAQKMLENLQAAVRQVPPVK